MTIDKNDFNNRFWGGIFGNFEKTFYEDAVVMKRFSFPKDDRKADCYETPMYHRNGFVSYIINVPKPPAPVCTGTIIIERTSKNRYHAALENGKSVVIRAFSTLKELETYAELFFE